MKVKNYLTETFGVPLPEKITDMKQEDFENIQQILNILKSKCGPFYRDIKRVGHLFYRGTYRVDWRTPIEHKITRQDRKPKDTGLVLHNLVDDMLEKKFGWRPRSQGVFTTSNKGQAVSYGNLFSIWPCGNYKFLWSDEARDLYNSLRSAMKIADSDMRNPDKLQKIVKDSKNAKKIKTIVDSFKDTNLDKAVSSGNEVIFGCDSYYLVNAHHNKYVGNEDMEDQSTVIEMAFAGKKFYVEDEKSIIGKEVKFDV